MTDKINILESDNREFDLAALKNSWIAATSAEYVAFLNKAVTNGQELSELLESYELIPRYEVVVFGSGVPEGSAGLFELLSCFSMEIFGMVFKRSLLIQTGRFNEKLSVGTNFELLCRLAGQCSPYCVPCAPEGQKGVCLSEEFVSETIPYILRSHMSFLHAENLLEHTMNVISCQMLERGCLQSFERGMSVMLGNTGVYERLEKDTAPFFVVIGNDICYGVLNYFGRAIADELVKNGQAVVTSDERYGTIENNASFLAQRYKGLIGFQSPALESEFFGKVKGEKYQFLFDNPFFLDSLLQNIADDYHILSQDGDYAKYVNRYFHTKNAIHFPPAGTDLGYAGNKDRPYDIIFMGSYISIDAQQEYSQVERCYYEYMLANPHLTFEEGFRVILKELQISLNDEQFREALHSIRNVGFNIRSHYRGKVLETILDAGYTIHVFGDSWNGYDYKGKGNLIIHPEVFMEESLQIMGKAKIGLNVMSWHKAGMTERIANYMLSGAVCISDVTTYLEENFVDGEEIILFRLQELERLPEKIARLLGDSEYRDSIAHKAYKKAAELHTWKKRTEQLLELVENV